MKVIFRVLLGFLAGVLITHFLNHSDFDKYALNTINININPEEKRPTHPVLKKWVDCMKKESESFKEDYEKSWNGGWGKSMKECQKLVPLNTTYFQNKDEKKYHIFAKVPNKTISISLGIGRDIEAEKKLQSALGAQNVEFYGADPIVEENEQLYSQIGKYFPFAVGEKGGYSIADVYTSKFFMKINCILEQGYKKKGVVHVDLVYFLKNMIKKTFYDIIWFDVEHAEYGLFPFFHRGGQLDQNNITICQFNLEIHHPDANKKKLTHDFLFRQIEDERYGYFYHHFTGYHYRLFVVNFDDKACVKKYLSDL